MWSKVTARFPLAFSWVRKGLEEGGNGISSGSELDPDEESISSPGLGIRIRDACGWSGKSLNYREGRDHGCNRRPSTKYLHSRPEIHLTLTVYLLFFPLLDGNNLGLLLFAIKLYPDLCVCLSE